MTPSQISNLISSRIIHRRNELGMTRREVVKAAGLHSSALFTYETNPQCKVTAVNLYRISNVLGVSMEYFFENPPVESPTKKLKIDYEKEEISYG